MNRINNILNKIGLIITNAVSTMWMAIVFALLALSGLPQALSPNGIGFVQWLSTAFLQLVLLSIIMVGQKLQADATITHVKKHMDKHHAEHIAHLQRISKQLGITK